VLDSVVEALVRATRLEKQLAKRDAETRRNAIMSLADLVATVGFGPRYKKTVTIGSDATVEIADMTVNTADTDAEADINAGLTAAQFEKIWNALIAATHDYATDNRGDVGSWARKAALESLERIVTQVQTSVYLENRVTALLSELQQATDINARKALFADLARMETPTLALHTLEMQSNTLQSQRGTERVAGFNSSISGYGAGTRLVSADIFVRPHALVSNNGLRRGAAVTSKAAEGESPFAGVIQSITAAGHICKVESATGESRLIPSAQLQEQEDATVHSLTLTLHSSAVQEGSGSYLNAPMVVEALGCFLRELGEKLDLLRGVSGEALCRLLHLPHPLPQVEGVAHRQMLEETFPSPYAPSATTPAAAAQKQYTGGFDLDVSVDQGGEDDDSEGKAAEAPTAQDASAETPKASAGTSKSIQWSMPNQCFPRLVALLALPEYVKPIMEGLVTSVGGLSESVVKHSASALVQWASNMKRSGATQQLALVAFAAASLLKPRLKQMWDEYVDAAGTDGADAPTSSSYYTASGSTGTHDPSMERWFREILGTAGAMSGSGGGNGTGAASDSNTKVDSRVITPTLRTVDTLLTAGCLDGLQAGAASCAKASEAATLASVDFASDLIAATKRRVQTSKDDAMRIMAAGSVYLGLLHFEEPVRSQAALALLDLLCHPFPRVRKVISEKFYVRLLTLEDCFTKPAGADGAPATDTEAALTVLTATPWSADIEALMDARDSLYGFLGVPMPEKRSGRDPEIFSVAHTLPADAQGKAAYTDGSDAGGYGALVREMGF
jgi:hypothetical protein